MAWDKGFNFRDTSAFVTDGTNQTYVANTGGGVADLYPTTRNGVTFGWNTFLSGSTRDRIDTNDPRLAGVQWGSGTPVIDFRVDLTATGDYSIDLALGDPAGGANSTNSIVYDNTTSLATITTASGSGQFVDASGVNRTSAALWVSGHATITKTFASTIFRVTSEVNLAPVTHVFLSQLSQAGNIAWITA